MKISIHTCITYPAITERLGRIVLVWMAVYTYGMIETGINGGGLQIGNGIIKGVKIRQPRRISSVCIDQVLARSMKTTAAVLGSTVRIIQSIFITHSARRGSIVNRK